MTKDSAREELAGLRERILRLQREYYIDGRPSVSDREYDRLFDRLLLLEKEHPDLVTPDSPGLRVGSDLDADFPESPHTIPVLSLDKAYTSAEVEGWMRKTRAAAGRVLSFMMEEKIDGVSIVLYYRDGLLERAVTRGNGYVGNDVTANVRTIREVPLRVDRGGSFAVRGEIFLPTDRFLELNAREETPYANPRNLAAGTLRRNKSSEAARVPLRLLVYEGYFDPPPDTHREVTRELAALGFPVNPRNRVVGGPPDPEAGNTAGADGPPARGAAGSISGTPVEGPPDGASGGRESLESLIRRCSGDRPGLPYQIDGLVFKVNELEVRDRLGSTGHHPRWAVAYKFESPQGLTTVEKIEIQVGRTGRVTPVARVRPVEIGGAVIVNVTLHNQAYVDALELSEGDQVAVSRRGDVIPAVERVVEKAENAPLWRMPRVCPSCGATLEDRGAHRFCPNTGGCPDQRRGRLVFFAGKGRMDIESLGAETMDFLWREGFVRDIPDIYRIPYDRLLEYPGFGEKKVELLRAGVEKSRRRPFSVLLPSLGIPEVGTKVTEILIAGGFGSMDRLLEAADRGDEEGLTALHGIGEKTARRILEELSRPEFRRLVEDLRAEGLPMAASPGTAPTQGVFSGQTWAVTGSFRSFRPRDLAMDEVERRGGRAVSAVSGSVTHLLAGEGAGSKLDKARKLGLVVVNEEEFLRMLGRELPGADRDGGE